MYFTTYQLFYAHHTRKETFYKSENQGADLNLSHHRLYNPSSSYNRDLKLLAFWYDCTAWFVADVVGNQIVSFLKRRLRSILAGTYTVLYHISCDVRKQVFGVPDHDPHKPAYVITVKAKKLGILGVGRGGIVLSK